METMETILEKRVLPWAVAFMFGGAIMQWCPQLCKFIVREIDADSNCYNVVNIVEYEDVVCELQKYEENEEEYSRKAFRKKLEMLDNTDYDSIAHEQEDLEYYSNI